MGSNPTPPARVSARTDTLARVLIRLFRGAIRDGMSDRMVRGLHDHVLPHLRAHPAVISTHLAFPLDVGEPREYLVESRWRSLGDLIRFAGDDWRTPQVEPCEEDLLVSVSAHHFVTDGEEAPAASEARPAPAEVWLDEVGIDGPRLQVLWSGSALHLPPREMAAMLTLASDPGAPVPAVELARRIWPGSVLVGPYDVRRVIHRLRTLVRTADVPVAIRNVHGRGYVLESVDPSA